MQATISHVGKMTFETTIRNHSFFQDTQVAAGGENKGPTPKELLLAGVIGCAGMDVVSLLSKKFNQQFKLKVESSADPRKEHPRIFQEIIINFEAEGPEAMATDLVEAVKLSLTKYCGVTAMVSNTVPVKYQIKLNGKVQGNGVAKFDV